MEGLSPIYRRVAGIDVHRMLHVVTVLIEQPDGSITRSSREFGGFKRDCRALAAWLAELSVQLVVMESTGIYWKSPYAHLERAGIQACVVNAHFIKHVPGQRRIRSRDGQGLDRGAFRGDVADHRAEFDAGVVEQFVQAVDPTGAHGAELAAIPGDQAQLAQVLWGDEAATYQAEAGQHGEPLRVGHVGLALTNSVYLPRGDVRRDHDPSFAIAVGTSIARRRRVGRWAQCRRATSRVLQAGSTWKSRPRLPRSIFRQPLALRRFFRARCVPEATRKRNPE